jgi:hypothetical protein
MIADLYVLRPVVEHRILCHFNAHRIAVALISKSNRPVSNFQSHIASQLAEHASMYSASAVLRAILDCFLLCHEIIVDLKLKQHPEVLFLSATLPAQSASVYPIRVKP